MRHGHRLKAYGHDLLQALRCRLTLHLGPVGKVEFPLDQVTPRVKVDSPRATVKLCLQVPAVQSMAF